MNNTTITKLTPIETQVMVSDFLKNIGLRLKNKRKIKNLSQKDLADCLNIDQSTLSKYENGDRDMQISLLPQFSAYCKFPLYELFPHNESQMILDTFSKAVTITVERKKRQNELQYKRELLKNQNYADDRILKAQVYEIDGTEVYEPVQPKNSSKTLREKYKDAEMHTEYSPYTEMEFCNYIKEQNSPLIDTVINAGQLIEHLEDIPHKDTLKGAIADFIVDELIINNVAHKSPDEVSRRAYAYYKKLYDLKMKDSADSADSIIMVDNEEKM